MYTEHPFTPKPFAQITDTTHEEHKKLYAGYVKNANTVLEKITQYHSDATKVYELGELYRHFAFEYNGMRNHEVYFSLLEGGSSDAGHAPSLHTAIAKSWESLDAWKSAFTSLALTRGIGWAMMSYDARTDSLLMHWVDEQHLGQLQGTIPIVALDMWEHSYVADYQPSGKKQYVADFMHAMNWARAEAVYIAAAQTHQALT